MKALSAGPTLKPAKILVCHNHYAEKGGESLVFENLVRGLREQGHPVVTYTRDNADIVHMSAAGRAAMVATAWHSGRTRRELAALVAREHPDVAIVQNVFPLLSPTVYTTLARHHVPVIQAMYNYRLVCPAAELYSQGEVCERSLRGNYLHCVARSCYRGSAVLSAWYASILGWHRWRSTFRRTIAAYHVPDLFMADKLAEGGLPRARMIKNINPFFVGDYTPTTSHRGYIAYAGRLVRHKGVITFIDAVRRVPRLKAVIVGHGEMSAELEGLVRRLGLGDRVEFLGPLWGGELNRVLGDACAVAVPSEWYDNLPLVLCQANALGKPVLASRINGIPEYVEDNVNGFLFTPGNAAELGGLAGRVLALNGVEYRALALRSRQYAEQHLDFSVHYSVLAGTIERVCRSAL